MCFLALPHSLFHSLCHLLLCFSKFSVGKDRSFEDLGNQPVAFDVEVEWDVAASYGQAAIDTLERVMAGVT